MANGFAVEVEDRGLGLSPAEYTALSTRAWPTPPEFDLADSDRLGLFVVGQLASPARHPGHSARLAVRRHHGHRADAAQPDRAGRRDGPAGRCDRQHDWSGQHGLGGQPDRASQYRRTASLANGQPFPAGHDRAGTRGQGTTFSLTGRHQPGPKSPETPPDPGPGRWLPAQARLHPQAQGQAVAPSRPSPGTCPARRAQRAVPARPTGACRGGSARRVWPRNCASKARTQPPADRAAPASLPFSARRRRTVT